jgi:hypothetical protein
MPGTTYPPAPPTIDGQGRITVEQYLKQPTRVQRAIADLTKERYLAERIFGSGNAEGGAVIYDQLTAADSLYTERDVQAIEPGSEFPLTDVGESAPKVAAVSKWGGAGIVTYEAARRDNRDVLNRKLTRIRNTIVRKVDTVAIAALNAAPINGSVGTDWSDVATRDAVGDIAKATNKIDNLDLGYVADTVLINPTQELELFLDKSLREALPKENTAANPIASGRISGLMGLTWYASNRVPVGTAYVLASTQAGSLHDELPLYSRVVDQPERERYLIQAARVTVPVVTDPLAVYRLTGL